MGDILREMYTIDFDYSLIWVETNSSLTFVI